MARRSLGDPLSLDLYETLHATARAHAEELTTYRTTDCQVHVERRRLDAGIEDVWAEHGCAPDVEAEVPPARVRLLFRYGTGDGPAIRARAEEHFGRYHDAVRAAGSRRERIEAIARLHQALELLHAWNDGNTRCHALLLDKLLVEQGCVPVVLTEINDVYVRRPDVWADMLEEGMGRWRVVRAAIADGEDVGARLREYDARGLIGVLGERRLREDRTSFTGWRAISFVAREGT